MTGQHFNLTFGLCIGSLLQVNEAGGKEVIEIIWSVHKGEIWNMSVAAGPSPWL